MEYRVAKTAGGFLPKRGGGDYDTDRIDFTAHISSADHHLAAQAVRF